MYKNILSAYQKIEGKRLKFNSYMIFLNVASAVHSSDDIELRLRQQHTLKAIFHITGMDKENEKRATISDQINC